MTRRPPPPRFATWLLQRFAIGPQREALIGDIVEQYEQGRSAMWYRRQVLMTVLLALVAFAQGRRRPVLRACALAIAVVWVLATAEWPLAAVLSSQNGLTILLNLGIFGYCAFGFGVLLATITGLDEPRSPFTEV